MAVTNPFEITYGEVEVGGSSSTYLLDGPYTLENSFERLRVSFRVIVVAVDHEELQSLCAVLEDQFRERDQSLTIDLGGNRFDYDFGTSILNTRAEAVKSGSPDTDQGVARAYRCTVEGDLPADGTQTALRDVTVHVEYTPGRQKIVTMSGSYTANVAGSALENYQANFDAYAATLLTALDGSATFELVSENHTQDRNDHLCSFTRQWDELLSDQSTGLRNDTSIRDHRFSFSDESSHPGDAYQGLDRLRRVTGTFECSIDIDVTTDLQTVYRDKIKPYILQEFRTTFTPVAFCVENLRINYDESRKRLSAVFAFLYQKNGGTLVVEAVHSAGYQESQHIDYTPVHGKGVYQMHADPGWATRLRTWSRIIMALGPQGAIRRIGNGGGGGSGNWYFGGGAAVRNGQVERDGIGGPGEGGSGASLSPGWNIISNNSSVSGTWVGDPEFEQMQMSVLNETVVEQWHESPSGGGGGGFPIFSGGSP